VFINIMPRKISVHKKDEVSGQFRILHNEELGGLCRLCSVLRMQWIYVQLRLGKQ
jgi:hypothetical protein